VPYALAARFLRRISAHLSNVASSVANPFDRVSGKEA
jgi:phosphate uptake regulator